MYLAQLNIGKIKYPLDSDEMKPFVDNLDPVNQLAEASDDFVWRLQGESGDATSFHAFDDPELIVNMSVWKSIDGLKNFMFRTHHKHFLGRRREWFEPAVEDTYVLWWIPQGHIPTVEEALERLVYLRENGDTPHAFTFKSNFIAEESGDFVQSSLR